MIVRLAQKKNDILSREIAKVLKLDTSAPTVCLIIKKSWLISCIQVKGSNISEQNGEMYLAFAKEHLSKVYNSGRVFNRQMKANSSFLDEKIGKKCGNDRVRRLDRWISY
ncbi:hypothetical protein AVEN_16390-1 [Araneus ventricosus]|uniref:Uncharacterized protein n=1 Tax=Araneus ventricosus TaxID=182803 RepID=A0A4Y2VC91_ARAVE|nr:hypothetical protein AVEN_102684-1 [Araneus ventricosus]GBO22212.1 hypothetical protein AVEN_16390-1 [Araneus ventricosus]